MRLVNAYSGAQAERYALEPLPCGASRPEVAREGAVVFVHEARAHAYLLLAQDAEKREIGQKRVPGCKMDCCNRPKEVGE